MTSTPWEVFNALIDLSYPVVCVNNIENCIYFPTSVYEPGVRTVLATHGWETASIRYISGPLEDPYPQYLDITRHDTLLRHELGTIVPHDNLASLADTSLTSLDDGHILVYSDGVWISRNSISGGTP